MQYQKPTFTLPTCNAKIDQTMYEIAVGLRCPICYGLFTVGKKHPCKQDA